MTRLRTFLLTRYVVQRIVVGVGIALVLAVLHAR